MSILIAEPRLPPRRLVASISQNRVERDQAEPRQPGHEAPQPQRDARERVVDPEHDRPTRSSELHQSGERGARIRRVVHDARGIDHVERARLQARLPQIGFHELYLAEAEAPCRRRTEQQRGARQVGADDYAIGAGQVQAHLAGPASDLDDSGIAGDRVIDQSGEHAAFGPRVKGAQVIARRVSRKRRLLVEAADGVGPSVAGKPQVGNPVRRVESRGAVAARPVGRKRPGTRRAREQPPEVVRQDIV
jgi:hypothetical protein